MNYKKLSISILKNIGSVLLTLTLVMIIVAWWGNQTPEKPIIAPQFISSSIQNNDLINLSEYKGKIVILNFWATWCPPCRLEIPSFERIAEEKSDVVFIGVSLDEESDLKEWFKDHSIIYPVLLPSQEMVMNYRTINSIDKIPTTFVIDKEGNIAKIQEGFYSEFQLRWDIFKLGGGW